MNGNWLRIRDNEDEILRVKLSDILQEVLGGNTLNWSILFLDGVLHPQQNVSIMELENKINGSENGLFVEWKDLILLSNKFSQIYGIVLLGCADVNMLKRYESVEEMQKNCDIVIELVDCAFWEVYSRGKGLISRLKGKFQDTEELKR